MRNQLLRDADWAGMAHSPEIRVPPVDIYFLKVNTSYLACKKPLSKLNMAAAPNKPLPDVILNRTKTGFSVPVREWFLGDVGSTTLAGRCFRGWAQRVYSSMRLF